MFEQIGNLIDVVIHFDDFLPLVIEENMTFVYFFLFLIIFLETGLVVQVPLFIEPAERIKVDTRTGEFISRA